jgi:hypothetical protein
MKEEKKVLLYTTMKNASRGKPSSLPRLYKGMLALMKGSGKPVYKAMLIDAINCQKEFALRSKKRQESKGDAE